jgi:hypothetical protein
MGAVAVKGIILPWQLAIRQWSMMMMVMLCDASLGRMQFGSLEA